MEKISFHNYIKVSLSVAYHDSKSLTASEILAKKKSRTPKHTTLLLQPKWSWH